MSKVYEKLRTKVLFRKLKNIEIENISLYDPYENDMQNEHTLPLLAEELETMPEWRDHYMGVDILLPRWHQISKSHVAT